MPRDLTDRLDGTDAKISLRIPFENTEIDITVVYLPQTQKWIIRSITYQYLLNGVVKTFQSYGADLITGGYPIFYSFNLPFAFFITKNDDTLSSDPALINDFSQGYNSFYYLDRNNMLAIRRVDVP